jgi:hypothetical protein
MMNEALVWIFTAFSFASFLGVLFGTDPNSAGVFIRTIFFLSLFFSLAGAFALFGILISKLKRAPILFETIFRRSILLAGLTTGVIVLEMFSSLNIWNAFAAFLLVVSLEMLAIHKK